MSNEQISKRLAEPFPQTAIKPHPNNRNLSYIEGHTIIRRLNDATDNRYDFRIISQDMRPFGKTSKGDDRLLITAIVELTIPNLGTRQHMGVQVVNAANGGEDMWKGAITDGIKKCATLFGVALDLLGPDYEAGEIAQSTPLVTNLTENYTRRQDAPVARSQAPRRDEPRTPASSGQRTEQGLTPRQREFIFAIARELGLSVEQIEAESSQSFSKSIGNLNRRDASIFIERLQQRRADQQRNVVTSGPPDPPEPDEYEEVAMFNAAHADRFTH